MLQQLSAAGNQFAQAGEGQTATPKIGKGARKFLNLEKFESLSSWNVHQRDGSDLGKVGTIGRERGGQKFINSPLKINYFSNNTIGHKSLVAHCNKIDLNNEWIVDLGATDHMINCNINLDHLNKLKNTQNVYLVDGSTTPISKN
jgi:hypothetical protein